MVSSPPASTAPPPPTATAPPTGGAVAALADRLHLEVDGPEGAPPVLLLHGWGSSAELMRAAGAPLVADRRVYNLDLPGHGRSPAPPEPWGVPEYAAAVAHVLRTRGLGPLPLVGHSNGGRIALTLASDPATAGLVERLVLVSPSGVRPDRPPSYYLKTAWARLLKAPFLLVPAGPLRERGLAWLRTTVYWRLIASGDYQAATGVMRATFVKTVNFLLSEERLARIAAPTLLLWGDRDTAVSRRQVDVLARAIPDAGLVVLEGAGHYGYLDAPAPYAAAARRFLGLDA